MREFQVIQNILPDIKGNSSDPPADQASQQRVIEVMNKVLGQSAQFLMPTLFQSGRLLLLTNAPVWASHIKNRQQSIIDEAAVMELSITEIKVKVQPVNNDYADQAAPEIKRSLSTQSLSSIEETSKAIDNPKLKQAFDRLQKRIRGK